MTPGVQVRYSLAEMVALTKVAVELDRLSAVDDIWTAYLDQASVEDVTNEGAELDDLAVEMVVVLESVRDSIGRLRSTLEAMGEEEIEAALREVERVYPELYGRGRELLGELLEEYSVRGVAIEACTYLEEQLPSEIRAVEEKRARLAAGEFQPGDMSPPERCALSAAKLGVASALVVVTGGGAAPIALGAVLALTEFGENWRMGCGALAGTVWGRLRHA